MKNIIKVMKLKKLYVFKYFSTIEIIFNFGKLFIFWITK